MIAAVAAEAIRIYSEIDFVTQARRLGDHLHGALADALGDHPLVGEARGRGFIAAVPRARRHDPQYGRRACKLSALYNHRKRDRPLG
ncbi:hypothetical protein [Mesorhizobium sp.]|uniref:hypothetical protein n=1 Tax=Mesorhizobium sp. TaxID=1871066 RepID=UPI0025F96021|nr:hypothetical protein [Mesorhizobium sp.]